MKHRAVAMLLAMLTAVPAAAQPKRDDSLQAEQRKLQQTQKQLKEEKERVAAARARETSLLAEASRLAVKRGNDTPGLYFIARCLRARRSPAARRYLLRTIRRNPLHWRAWISILTGR